MKIWNSKYALSKGILEQDAKDLGNGMVRQGEYQYLHGEGREWHRTRESAAVRAETMRKDKIASLRKQIARLEAMTFDAPAPAHNGG